MSISSRTAQLSVAHIPDEVLQWLELLRRDASARSVFLHDRDVGCLAVMGDPLSARERRHLGRLAIDALREDASHWMWPTIKSTIACLPVAGYTVSVVRDDGPIPVAEAIAPYIDRLAERLPPHAARSRESGPAAAPPARATQASCSFCGSAAVDGRRLISGKGVGICDACVVLCQEALAGRKTPAQARELQARAAACLDAAQRTLEALKFGEGMQALQGAESALADLLSLIAPLLP